MSGREGKVVFVLSCRSRSQVQGPSSPIMQAQYSLSFRSFAAGLSDFISLHLLNLFVAFEGGGGIQIQPQPSLLRSKCMRASLCIFFYGKLGGGAVKEFMLIVADNSGPPELAAGK